MLPTSQEFSADLKRYYAQYLPYVMGQPPIREDLIASILEKNTIEFSAQQEWENEWNQAGLASRLSEQVCIHLYQHWKLFSTC